MVTKSLNPKERLVAAADQLVQLKGFKRTSLADIARAAEVPLGNVYYHFKTKDALGQALIEQRRQRYENARAAWDALPDPRARIEAFIQMTIDNRSVLAQSGCPIGSLCQELHKQRGKLAENAAGMFVDFLRWLEAQFRDMGHAGAAAEHAEHLLSALEGATLLTHSFNTPDYVVREAERLKQWVRTL